MQASAIVAIAALTLISGAAVAGSGDAATGAHAPCWQSGTTVEITNCFAESGKQSNVELNRTYARIMTVLEGGDRQRLRKAERAWAAYRDATCDAEYELWDGGSGGPAALLACVDRETRRQTEHLRTTYRLRLQRLNLQKSER